MNASFSSICSDAAGNIYAGGAFTNSSGKYYLEKWDGKIWNEVGGLNSLYANSSIHTISIDAAGNIYVGGYFSHDNGVFYVAKWNGKTWSELGGLNSLGANSYIASIYADKVSGRIFTSALLPETIGVRHSWWAYYQAIPLPLQLNSFSANQGNTAINLQWQTANEVNTQSFTIERSADGKNFTSIGTVAAVGNGNNNYSFADNSPLPIINYYRLKMIDKDGSFTYSKVINVSMSSNNSITLSPNPATSQLLVKGKNMVSIAVLGMDGKTLFQQKNNNPLQAVVPVTNLPKGTYLLKVSSADNKVSVRKFVKE